jgi:hypothetical protein
MKIRMVFKGPFAKGGLDRIQIGTKTQANDFVSLSKIHKGVSVKGCP